jgi:hypothetical protein
VTVDHVLEEQRRYYAARAPEYDDWWFRRGRYALDEAEDERWRADVEEVEAALADFAPVGAVVELAAGTGLWTRQLARRPEERFDGFWSLVRRLVVPGGRVFLLEGARQFLYGSGR